MLLICSMRPDRDAPGWQVRQTAKKDYGHCYDEVSLKALTDDDTSALVDGLLKATVLTPASRQLILKKTDGNPFFVEEVIRTLIDRELIVPETSSNGTRWRLVEEIDDTDLPGNLQSLLVARIDRLELAARRTLQMASVIGRSFYFRVLDAIYEAISPASMELDEELITLQRKELIRQAAVLPEPEYMFRHALAQEAAYSTILLRQRQMFHRLTGNAIEVLFAEQLDEFYAILAYHFSRADEPRSVRYATLAGDAAYRLFAIPEALGHYALALETLQAKSFDESWVGPDGARTQNLIHLFRRHARRYSLWRTICCAGSATGHARSTGAIFAGSGEMLFVGGSPGKSVCRIE
jgi:predicted ATPase